MSDLRQFAAELIANPLVPVPPIEGVVARARHIRAARRRRQVGAGLCLVAMTLMAVARAGVGAGDSDSLRMVGDPASEEHSGPSASSGSMPGGTSTTFPTLPWSGQSFEGDWSSVPFQRSCPVLRPPKPEIKVLANDMSIGEHPRDAVEKLFESINGSGGICGRHITLGRGNPATTDLSEYLAVLGLPLDDGLDKAIADYRLAGAGIPVIADGLSGVQHRSRLVYPVGPSAGALTRTATAHAIAEGAKSFAIVYDAKHTFGREAAQSFDQYLQKHGGDLKAAIPLDPSANAYAPQADRLTSACGADRCDFVFLALLPETAQKWMATNPAKPRVQLAGLSTVLADGFTDHCFAHASKSCDGLVAWSGYVPRTPAWFSEDADHAYGKDGKGSTLRESAVVAARVLREALLVTGPDVTRESLRTALDSMTFTSSITAPLSWPSTDRRVGKPMSKAWVLRTAGLVPDPPSQDDDDPPNQGEAEEQARRYLPDFSRIGVPDPGWYPGSTGWVRDPG